MSTLRVTLFVDLSFKTMKSMNELLKKLKKRPAYPFENIAVAIAFSPRLERIISQGKFIADALGSQLVFIHVGDKTREKENELNAILDSIGINQNKVRIIWAEGDIVETILKLCKLNVVDLLILGPWKRKTCLSIIWVPSP